VVQTASPNAPAGSNLILVGEDFGIPSDTRPLVSGVAFRDANGNGAYDIGEGLSGVNVSISTGTSTLPPISTTDAGSFGLAVTPNNTYTVTISGGGLTAPQSTTVFVGTKNVEVRFTLPALATALAASATAIAVGNLSAPLLLDGRQALPASSAQRLTLTAGSHTLAQSPGQSVTFQVAANGTVSYDRTLEGALAGAGTKTLVVLGRTVTVDARPLSAPLLVLNNDTRLVVGNSAPFRFTGLPGALTLSDPAAAGATVAFNLTAAGTVGYAAALQGVLTGAGTSALAVHGRAVTLDTRPLSTPFLTLDEFVSVRNAAPVAFTDLPGTYTLVDSAASQAAVAFDVTAAGTVRYAAALEGLVTGAGTQALRVNGEAAQIDARALSARTPSFSVAGLGLFSTSVVQTLHVLPGQFHLQAGTLQLAFTLTNLDQLAFASSLDPLLLGRGTNRLVLRA
jgi:hypothetical protein